MRPDLLGGATRRGTVLVGKGLHGVTKVPEQMPSIGDLDRSGRTLTDPVGISASAIASNDLDAGMAVQPACHRCGFPIGQEIDDRVRLKIHHHRAVAMTPPPSPIVNPQNPRGRSGCLAE